MFILDFDPWPLSFAPIRLAKWGCFVGSLCGRFVRPAPREWHRLWCAQHQRPVLESCGLGDTGLVIGVKIFSCLLGALVGFRHQLGKIECLPLLTCRLCHLKACSICLERSFRGCMTASMPSLSSTQVSMQELGLKSDPSEVAGLVGWSCFSGLQQGFTRTSFHQTFVRWVCLKGANQLLLGRCRVSIVLEWLCVGPKATTVI